MKTLNVYASPQKLFCSAKLSDTKGNTKQSLSICVTCYRSKKSSDLPDNQQMVSLVHFWVVITESGTGVRDK